MPTGLWVRAPVSLLRFPVAGGPWGSQNTGWSLEVREGLPSSAAQGSLSPLFPELADEDPVRLLQGPLAFVSLRGGWVHELQSLGAASCAGGRFQPVDVGPSAGPQAPSRGTLRGILRGPRSVTLCTLT